LKKLLFLSLFAFIGFSGFSQVDLKDYEPENEGWLVKMDEAIKLSEQTGKPIMANFTGSDWCGWCKRLTASVFSKSEFKKWADKNVILLELDYPKRKKLPTEIRQQNDQLRQVFKVRGYPSVWVFKVNTDATSGQRTVQPYGKLGYEKTVKSFTSQVDRMIAAVKK